MYATSKGKGKSTTSYYPTPWSNWEWDDDLQRRKRYRLRSDGEYEYEWDNPGDSSSNFSPAPRDYLRVTDTDAPRIELNSAFYTQYQQPLPTFSTAPPNIETAEQVTKTRPCTWPTCDLSFNTIQERDRHYQTMHANDGKRPHQCLIPGCQAAVRSWTKLDKLRAHNKQWHGPYHCPVFGCSRGVPNGFPSQMDLDIHQESGKHGGVSEAMQSIWTAPSSMSPSTGMVDEPGLGFSSGTSGQFKPPDAIGASLFGVNDGISNSSVQTALYTPVTSHIRTRDQRTGRENFDPSYKVHHNREFRFGRVFKVLWAEPKGNSDSKSYDTDASDFSVREGRHGEMHYEKVRRFVIINIRPGHCICLPINTYGHQGTLKAGVQASHHAVVYNSNRRPVLFPGELDKGLTHEPIAFLPDKPRNKLLDGARLNYAKPYTIEMNVKVRFIGSISRESQPELVSSYNNHHPPLQAPTPLDPSSSAPTGSYEPHYPGYPRTSAASYNSDGGCASTKNEPSGSLTQTSLPWNFSNMLSALPNLRASSTQQPTSSIAARASPDPGYTTTPMAKSYNSKYNSYDDKDLQR